MRTEIMLDKGLTEAMDSSSTYYNFRDEQCYFTFSNREECLQPCEFDISFPYAEKDHYLSQMKQIKANTTLFDTSNPDMQVYRLNDSCFFRDVHYFATFKRYMIVVVNKHYKIK